MNIVWIIRGQWPRPVTVKFLALGKTRIVYLFSDTRVKCDQWEGLDNLLERHNGWLQVPAVEDEVRFRIELLQ